MKKFKLFILIGLFAFFMPTLVFAKDKDICEDSIKIESVKLTDTNGGAEEISEASVSGLKLNLNMKMFNPNDSLEYTLNVKNDSNEDMYFDEKSLNFNNDYFEYKYSYNDGSNIVKAGESKIVKLNVNYKNKIPEEKLQNGLFKNTDDVTLVLANKDGTSILDAIKNPETMVDNPIIYFAIILFSLISIGYLTKKNKSIKFMAIILGFCIVIPTSVFALCEYRLKLQSNIVIDQREATFLPGPEFNVKIKKLAGADDKINTYNAYYSDSNITSIIKSDTEPSDSNKEEKNIVSTSDSEYPIYMWFEDGTIYWWSEVQNPSLNSDSSKLLNYITNLTNIDGLKYFDTLKVNNFNRFLTENKLTNLDSLSSWDTSNVTNLEDAFWGCNKLENVDGLKNWNTSNVTNLRELFMWDHSLKNIDGLKNWDTSRVTSMSGTFYYCENLTNSDSLSNWNTLSVVDMSSMFSNCSKITDNNSIVNWDISNVTNFKYMFSESPSPYPKFTNVSGTWDSDGTFKKN